tara:strand:+ start:395 stop:661 length:267 start_codon:yes stop_codon:yes gene_type:complete
MLPREYQGYHQDLGRTEGDHILDWDIFDTFCKALNSENKAIFKGKILKKKSLIEILKMPSVKISGTSTVKKRFDKLMLQFGDLYKANT